MTATRHREKGACAETLGTQTRGSCCTSARPPLLPAGPYWTHVLFTWKSKEGLKVYVNGTLSTSDPSGKVAHAYGEPNVNLVIASQQDQSKRYENRAFDEFIIWERALSPDEVALYFTAAIGQCVGGPGLLRGHRRVPALQDPCPPLCAGVAVSTVGTACVLARLRDVVISGGQLSSGTEEVTAHFLSPMLCCVRGASAVRVMGRGRSGSTRAPVFSVCPTRRGPLGSPGLPLPARRGDLTGRAAWREPRGLGSHVTRVRGRRQGPRHVPGPRWLLRALTLARFPKFMSAHKCTAFPDGDMTRPVQTQQSP